MVDVGGVFCGAGEYVLRGDTGADRSSEPDVAGGGNEANPSSEPEVSTEGARVGEGS